LCEKEPIVKMCARFFWRAESLDPGNPNYVIWLVYFQWYSACYVCLSIISLCNCCFIAFLL